MVENILPVEIKAVEHILPVHEAQIITYLKLLEKPEGLLINFNVTNIFYEGQKPMSMSFSNIWKTKTYMAYMVKTKNNYGRI